MLLRGAQQREAAAGRTLHFAGDRERHVELVVQGLIRVHASAPDGRTLTIRYCRPGSLMGILSLYAEPMNASLASSVQGNRLQLALACVVAFVCTSGFAGRQPGLHPLHPEREEHHQ